MRSQSANRDQRPDGFLEGVARIGGVLRRRLEAIAGQFPGLVAEVRGLGLMLGVKMAVNSRDAVARVRGNGLLTVAANDDVLRLLPPLIIDESHVEEAAAILERSFAEISP